MLTCTPCQLQVDVHNNLGDLWRAQGTMGRAAARQCYTDALNLDAHYAPAWRGLGDLFREEGNLQQALSCYQVSTPFGHRRMLADVEWSAA